MAAASHRLAELGDSTTSLLRAFSTSVDLRAVLEQLPWERAARVESNGTSFKYTFYPPPGVDLKSIPARIITAEEKKTSG